MKNFAEFKARFESDAAFRAKFAGVKDENQLIDVAKAEGYDLSGANELLSDEQLDNVAGGNLWDDIKAAFKLYDTVRGIPVERFIEAGKK